MRYTLKDIAEEVGVSVTTVSLVVNDQPCRVSDKTRRRILDTVEKYNYTPNPSARALVTKKTETIGLILPDISNPFFSELAKGVERVAQKEGYFVIFCNSNNLPKNDIKNTRLLISKQIDGLIIVPSFNDEDIQEIKQFVSLLQKSKLPVVFADRAIPFHSFNTISSNHRVGGQMATSHLIELGHKRIGCITGPRGVESSQSRFKGYQDALQFAGISFDKSICLHGDYQIDSGYTQMAELIDKKVTAVFACNDLMSLGALKQLRDNNLSPEDISVIGYDDIALGELFDYPLTTVNQNLYEVGKTAFKLILSNLNDKSALIENTTLIPKLVIRNTTFKMN